MCLWKGSTSCVITVGWKQRLTLKTVTSASHVVTDPSCLLMLRVRPQVFRLVVLAHELSFLTCFCWARADHRAHAVSAVPFAGGALCLSGWVVRPQCCSPTPLSAPVLPWRWVCGDGKHPAHTLFPPRWKFYSQMHPFLVATLHRCVSHDHFPFPTLLNLVVKP